MKTGIELIAEERQEQIYKHGFSLQADAEFYKNKELKQAGEYCLMLAEFPGYVGKNLFWPESWDKHFMFKIHAKAQVDKLIVAGALLMAENERRGDKYHELVINQIAAEIDRLQKQ